MLILIMGIAHAQAFVLDLTTPAASQRHKRRIATDPLLTTRGFHSRRRGIATEPAMLAGHRLGFQAVVRHRGPFCGGGFVRPRARLRGASRRQSLYPLRSSSSQSNAPPWPEARGMSGARVMSQLSKVTHSRNQWKHTAKQRGDRDRYQRKQHARLSAERDRGTTALKAAQARLQQLEAQSQGLAVQNKVDLVFLAL